MRLCSYQTPGDKECIIIHFSFQQITNYRYRHHLETIIYKFLMTCENSCGWIEVSTKGFL